ncbi:MAG: V-type ATP synthase subunit E [Chlamydiales bacterium]|nr:V-type ATP synthase subunit E [Chlamydiales bacterium]
METTEHGQDKVKKICEALKTETLDPARREAEIIVKEAKLTAEKILSDGHKKAEALLHEAKEKIAREKATAESALKMSARQTIETLKLIIEKEFFNKELVRLIETELTKPNVVAKLVETIVKAIEKEGIEADLEAIIPKSISAEEVNKALGAAILTKLKAQGVTLGEIVGGAEVKMLGQHLTLDISDTALKNLLTKYIRDDFRELIFSS